MSETIYSDKIKVNCPLIHDESGYFHLVYQITNLVNGKIYIGKHTTKNPYDNYMGSGKGIIRALKKYGIGNFTKEILFCFDKETDAFLKEGELVTQEFVDRDDTYNMIVGGKGYQSGEAHPFYGGGENHPCYGKHQSQETREKRSKATLGEKNPFYGRKHSQETKAKMSEQHWNCSGEKNPMYGKKHSQETKEKMTKAKKGKKSSFYGKHHKQESKEKMSKAKQGKPRSQETKIKISKAIKGKYTGENSPNYGKHHTQETKDKMSKAHKGENNPFAKVILKLDEFGNIVNEYGCMKDCCQQEDISNRKKLNKIIKERILYNGFYFEFKN